MEGQKAQRSLNFTMRGEGMTRIETFVAAAFAFAVTMMVISVGTIPENMDDFVLATKQIPAFAASCALIIWIWHTHASWCRRYGLEDGPTIFLSSSLIILVLVYIYPLRLMMQGLFQNLTDGYLPMPMSFESYWEIRFMFAFYGIGFWLLCLNFISLYAYALSKNAGLKLNQFEVFYTKTEILMWAVASLVCLLSISISIFLNLKWIGFSGYAFFLLFPLLTALGFYRKRLWERLITMQEQAADVNE
jgi:hypothetical protein